MQLIVVCVPAYNEEKTIAKVVLLAQRHADMVIVCDDGSADLTADIAETLGAKVIRHNENMGKGAALSTLFKTSTEMGADIVVTLDADGQHDPNELPKVVQPILNGEADIVIGSRFVERNSGMPRYRRIGNKFLNFLTNVTAKEKLRDTQSGYRAYSKTAVQKIEITEKGMGVDSQILMDARGKGLRVVECSIACAYEGETSTYNPVRHTADVVVSLIRVVAEKRPFLYFGVPGATLLIIGMCSTVWLLNSYLTLKQFSVILAMFAMATTIIGLLLAFTAIILNAIASLKEYS